MNVAQGRTGTATGIDLAWLFEGRAAAPRLTVGALRSDSRTVRAGDAFVALRGAQHHGIEFAAQAAAAGAAAIVWDSAHEPPAPLPATVALVPVAQLERDLGDIADRAYREPSARARVTGLTGTNGKTTCAWLLAQAWGAKGAYLGTLGAGFPPALVAGTHTTPDCLAVHRKLARLVDRGARQVAMEVSSHALDQDRIAGVRMPVVGFTNLSRDHLDYHGTMAAYGAAKERLLRARGVEHAVLNLADPFLSQLAKRLPSGVELTAVGVPPRQGLFVAASAVRALPDGLVIDGRTHFGVFRLRSRLIGDFNAENLLLTLGLLLATGTPQRAALEQLARVEPPPGRMESFALPQGATALVDYAHTPDALGKALAAARRHCRAKLWCVFGCGGDRDPGKRPEMGAIAESLADTVVLTDDNPRGEAPAAITDAILAGFNDAGRVVVEHDRARAIGQACTAAGNGDVIVIAGKGHETYQIVGAQRRAFSDRAIVEALARGKA